MVKLNCWEFKKCERQQGGSKTLEFGVCPASAMTGKGADTNGGRNGGRICWSVTGTLGGGKVQGSFAEKQFICARCDFYKTVKSEEGPEFKVFPKK